MVNIYLPKAKRAFTKITTADNLWFSMNDEKTFKQLKDEYNQGAWLSNKDIMLILDTYIKNGYGDNLIGEFFR